MLYSLLKTLRMSGLKITRATYGAGTDIIDVTGAVQKLVKNGELNVVVTPDSLGVTDPAPQQTKTLTVSYTINNSSVNTATAEDNGMIKVSAPPAQAADGLKIIKAEYGVPGNMIDVTNALKSQIVNGNIKINVSPVGVGVPDPNPSLKKSLQVEYTLNGSVHQGTFRDGEVFQVNAPPFTGSPGEPDHPAETAYNFYTSSWSLLSSVLISYITLAVAFVMYDVGMKNYGKIVGYIGAITGWLLSLLMIPFILMFIFFRRLVLTTDLDLSVYIKPIIDGSANSG